MRIRKRTPARAASPGPTAPLRTFSPPPPPLPPQKQPKFWMQEEEEEKTSLVVAIGEEQEQEQVTLAAKRAMGVPKPDPEQEPQCAGAAAVARCSRNDGKQWRCKGAAIPGYAFCDRHVAWSTRMRKPRPSKKNRSGSVLLDPKHSAKEEPAEEQEAATTTGSTTTMEGFQGKQARSSGDGPAA